jgi:LPXTG-site transpeptidase (sortase) family protein
MRSLTHGDNILWRGLRAIERALLVTALIALSWYGWRTYEINRQQAKATAEIDRVLESVDTSSGREVAASPPPPVGGLIGRLTIPRLHLSAPVKAGDNETVLDFSVAYLRDTPLPWASGNSAFAAHRDRLFRPLQDIQEGDDIELSTIHGDLHYRVLRTLIVEPQDVWVLDPLPKVSLTLITCYPFYFVGRAPQRFIVQAEKL